MAWMHHLAHPLASQRPAHRAADVCRAYGLLGHKRPSDCRLCIFDSVGWLEFKIVRAINRPTRQASLTFDHSQDFSQQFETPFTFHDAIPYTLEHQTTRDRIERHPRRAFLSW